MNHEQCVVQVSTLADFEQLLTMVERVPVTEVDPQLLPLQTMPVAWYRGLVRALVNKYRSVPAPGTGCSVTVGCVMTLMYALRCSCYIMYLKHVHVHVAAVLISVCLLL